MNKTCAFLSFKKTTIYYVIFLCLTGVIQSAAIAQDVSTPSITLNGDPIDEELLYYGSLFLLDSHERCSPVSDELLRERVVDRILLKQRYVEILETSGDSQERLNRYATYDEETSNLKKYIEDENPTEEVLNQLRYNIAINHFPTNYSSLIELIGSDITAEQIENKYDRLVSENHPLIQNLVVVRVKPVGATTVEESKLIYEMFKSGSNIDAVRDALEFKVNPLADGRRWIPVMPKDTDPLPDYNGSYWRDRFPEWNTDLEVGHVVGPYVHWLNQNMSTVQKLVHDYYYIAERIEIDKLPLTGIKDSPTFTYAWITRLLEKAIYDTMTKELRANAVVRVNGEIVSSDVEFAGCADRTEHSVLYKEAMNVNPSKTIKHSTGK